MTTQAVKPLIFLHIPKTAGTSVIELVSRNFAHDEVCRVSDIHRDISEITADIEVAIAEGRRFICGHFSYAAVSPLAEEVTVFTMLRDPVERIVSLYKFWRGREPGPGASAASLFAAQVARALSFEEFMACEHPLIVSATRDEMCKALLGHVSQDLAERDPGEIYLEARSSLAGMPFGLVGDLDRSLRYLSRQLGINLLDPVRVNTTDDLDALPLTGSDRQRITRGNLGDTLLYEFAARTFDRLYRASETAALHRDIGDKALAPLVADDRGGFVWDASMPVSGRGWNHRETAPDGSCYRFTSTPETTLHLPNRLAGRAFTITIDVAFYNPDPLLSHVGPVSLKDTMKFSVNDMPVEAQVTPAGEAGGVFRLSVPREQVTGPVVALSMWSRFGLSPSVFGSPDKRNLLAAIRSVRLG